MPEDEKENEIEEMRQGNKSTVAENILALKEFFSSEEIKIFVNGIMLVHKEYSWKNTIINMVFMIAAFACIGLLAYFKLVAEGTTGVLAGIIIGYFFKKND